MHPDSPSETFLKEIKALEAFLEKSPKLEHCTILGLDLRDIAVDWANVQVEDTTFLGCQFAEEIEATLRAKGAIIFPKPSGLPFQPFRKALYTWQELMEGFDPDDDQSTDLQIYQDFFATRFNPPLQRALYQRIHDHSIDEALRDLLQYDSKGMTELRCVGFMGGHSKKRTDHFYKKSAQTAQLLAQNGYFVVSGGGPGIMEAANLGAYLSNYSESDLQDAIGMLEKAPHYTDRNFHQAAMEVLEKYPDGAENLAVPTWFYGHEPSNLFASHIAKYFSNSIREDTLLAISLYGVVFAPGSAGTTQEIFMDATQNHYGTFNYYSPMVFLGRERYEIETMIYPTLRQLSWNRTYHGLLHCANEPEEVLSFLQHHPPIPVEAT